MAEGQRHRCAEGEIDGCSLSCKNPQTPAMEVIVVTIDVFDYDLNTNNQIKAHSLSCKNPQQQATEFTIVTIDAFDCDLEIHDQIKARCIVD